MAWNPNVPTVTNRVQDDLDAIRENFQVLDGHLADTNNPHNVQAQQVPYSSGVSGFSPADVATALDALAGARIVEMGSNSNGHYVRWENGLQVCTFIHPDGISVDPESYADYDWTPPAQFVEFYAVLMVPSVAGGSMGVISQTHGVLNTDTRAVLRNNASISRIMHPRFIAIGRWK